jgi:pimeloyl-ACP methyl ester carboxylesterase/tellurite resistance protein
MERREDPVQPSAKVRELPKRPIVIIDPRAGHGPGIGGSKQDSEIGMALKNGHPVYFMLFYTEPCKGQTLADVQAAQVRFLEEVRRRHPDTEKPAIIGNCQAGWAAALVAADRPDISGPLVLNGSPLSYWSGVEGANPMRYRGGLLGGIWMNSLLSDLGNGLFDGANLVANFENLNPANTYWTKLYTVYDKVDTEEDRFLDFEKWWGGFFMLTRDEIHFIVENLFVGNRLERGKLWLQEGQVLDLKKLEDPIVIFASSGDNITPPQQALNWIPRVYETTEDLKRHKQVIIYIVHEDIGHLGIFVSGKVAQKEHNQIIGSVEMIPYLAPGLYEMIIEEEPSKPWMNDYKVRFEERSVEQILKYDDGVEDEAAFIPVSTLSQANDYFYKVFVSPLVQKLSNRYTAEALKQLHPLRVQRYAFSDLNPFMLPFKTMARMVLKDRKPIDRETNFFARIEKDLASGIEDSLNTYRDMRDKRDELLFKALYDTSVMQFFFAPAIDNLIRGKKPEAELLAKEAQRQSDREFWLSKVAEGGFKEGLVRIMVAMINADAILDHSELIMAQKIIMEHPRLRRMKPDAFRKLVVEQSRILQIDREEALNALPRLIHLKKDREEALAIADRIAHADEDFPEPERQLMDRLRASMNIA